MTEKQSVEPVMPSSPVKPFGGLITGLLIKTNILVENEDFLPLYESDGAACVDLRANTKEILRLPPRASAKIGTGIKIELQPGYKALIVPRSSLAGKGLVIPNSPGTIDPDYRGEVQVLVRNVGREIISIEPKERFAQMSLDRIYLFDWVKVDSLTPTDRGEGGFGSTGSKGGDK